MGEVGEEEKEEAAQEQLVLHSLTKALVNRLEALLLNLEPELSCCTHAYSASVLTRYSKVIKTCYLLFIDKG